MRSCVPNLRQKPLVRTVKITGYTVTNTSHDTSRDGAVTVHLDAGDSDAVCEILWTNGVTETSRILSGIRPGVYGAIVLTLNGKPVECLHACAVARVRVETRTGAFGDSSVTTSDCDCQNY